MSRRKNSPTSLKTSLTCKEYKEYALKEYALKEYALKEYALKEYALSF